MENRVINCINNLFCNICNTKGEFSINEITYCYKCYRLKEILHKINNIKKEKAYNSAKKIINIVNITHKGEFFNE